MNKFTKEEIKTAKEVKDTIIREDVEELKAIYMAGEICMWDEIQQREQLINFLWEQYKVKKLITKKTYLEMTKHAKNIEM